MPKPTEDMRELLRAIQTEIGAGKGFGSDQLTEVHNAACDRAIAIVRSYHDGVGLFQLTGEVAKMNWPDSCPSNEGAKPEVVTKPARNIPENIPMQACQPEPDNSCNPQSLQQKLAAAILDSETLTGILLDIVQERCDQDRTWGGPANDDKHTGYEWVALITKQLGRAVDAAFDGDAPEYCTAMVRVAALAVAAIQSVRRKAWAEGEQLSARDKCRGK